jgi:hypothetical protein
MQGPHILVTTEKHSKPLDEIQEKYPWPTVYYFHHVFAAQDWFRGYEFDSRILLPDQRNIQHKYISFNRITSGLRAYRSLLLAKLCQRNLLDQGLFSFDSHCPMGTHYRDSIEQLVSHGLIPSKTGTDAINSLDSLILPRRIDHAMQSSVPNDSSSLGPLETIQTAFCYLVTETCFWEQKYHLTEKIFKPIASMMPFVLAGPAHSLKYLQEYGFKTFDRWWDESYDAIEDPLHRIEAICDVIDEISTYSNHRLECMLTEMEPVLIYNQQRFFGKDLTNYCWRELQNNLTAAVNMLKD